jgi:hypothetical protein
MIKKYLAILMIAVATVTAFTGCKKYEEGPALSLLSKKSRLAGEWKLVKYLYNGAEQNLSGFTVNLTIEKGGSYTSSASFNNITSTETGTWEFNDDKTSVNFMSTNSSVADVHMILKLKSKELWTKQVSGSDTDEYHYEQ